MTCPMCDRETVQKYRPFCSRRCADLDLAKWFNGGYAAPSNDPDDMDDLEQAMDRAARDADRPEKPH
ncbi:DNA gyrase inhibitor YacG [Sulfitobacter sabulilitoris]|uniref:DNA gyrase inhibitor YacG n=1 Tax=Sulfitobacter sabulilitoris TaxID=2562655 RepID=A0A5S3PCT8_9RHOB|nr:DNA gyrase inhibitor YacG [Sulfitobacter sabulilitoris]TMM51673.1 DNA gyrase inhibitor YacG [Sulfitobacter sabulilitoris]